MASTGDANENLAEEPCDPINQPSNAEDNTPSGTVEQTTGDDSNQPADSEGANEPPDNTDTPATPNPATSGPEPSIPEANAATEPAPLLFNPTTSPDSPHSLSTTTITVTSESRTSITFSSPFLTNMSSPDESANAAARGSEPTNPPSSSASSTTAVDQDDQSQPATGAPPPGGPPPRTPPVSAATPEPEPVNRDATSPAEDIPVVNARPQVNNTRGVPLTAPPIGASAAAAMAAQFGIGQRGQPIIILNGQPAQQNPAFVAVNGMNGMNSFNGMTRIPGQSGISGPNVIQASTGIPGLNNNNSNQPFLWVNPPLVAPSVPAPQPGTQGSWCYPSQSPFWAGGLPGQTAPAPTPQVYVANQGYVAEPTFVATHYAPATPQQNLLQQHPQHPQYQQQPQMPRVQYLVNGTTGPIVYYTT